MNAIPAQRKIEQYRIKTHREKQTYVKYHEEQHYDLEQIEEALD